MNTCLPGNNGYFNMNTSGKYAVVLTNLFLLKDLKKLTSLFLMYILKYVSPAHKNLVLLRNVLSLTLNGFPPPLKFQMKVFQWNFFYSSEGIKG